VFRVFENGVLRKTSGHNEDVTGAWRIVQNEELHNSYYLTLIR
jgi:hypothetical protein